VAIARLTLFASELVPGAGFQSKRSYCGIAGLVDEHIPRLDVPMYGAVPMGQRVTPYGEIDKLLNCRYSIFTSGVHRAAASEAAFPREKPHFAELACAE
jgi:hypothetical protein